MDYLHTLQVVAQPLGEAIQIEAGPNIKVLDRASLGDRIETIVRTASFGEEPDRSIASWLIRTCAVNSGILPASINDLYLARGRGETRNDFTVPAINLRAIAFYAARSVFRAAMPANAQAIIFEIARSEMGYTDQSPSEYASCVLAAALAEGYQGPVFIQGDHFQVSASRYAKDPQSEVGTIHNLAQQSIAAGFYNIDIDTSTLVDLEQPTIQDQQKANYSLCAQLTAYLRSVEPEGVTVSVGGEIGEVGGKNSTEPELRAFMEGFAEKLAVLNPGSSSLSKISIQTGTSHGGVVLPDGSIAQVKVDFDTLEKLGITAKEYGMGGVVQHGASTLPEDAFSRFVDAGTLEVHLATNFQNILYDRLPQTLREEIYSFLHEKHSHERKSDQTDDQFYYTTRKRAIGPFKSQLWNLPPDLRFKIEAAWEDQFRLLFERLNVGGTQREVEQHIHPGRVCPPLNEYLGKRQLSEDASDLAD